MEGVTWQSIFNATAGLAGGLGAIVIAMVRGQLKEQETELKSLAAEQASIRVLVAGKYVTRDELQQSQNAIMAVVTDGRREQRETNDRLFRKLDDISSQLSSKADRP